MVNQHLQDLINKEVSRKEFLGISALALGSVVGFGSIIKLLTGKSLSQHKLLGHGMGYGNASYGGK